MAATSITKVWEKATIRRPIVSYPIFETSCGPEYADELTLQPDALYLVFASQNRDGKTYIQTAARLESLDDPIIDAYRKIGEDAEDAPHKMSAETYFGHVESFAEIEILECPKAEDFKYEDSRGAIGKQKDVFYAIRDKLNTTGQSLDIRNAFSYVQQMNDGPKDINFKNVECQYGDRYLYIDGDYDKYLKVNNGLIDTTKIGTRIDITGNHLISLADVKKWISAATAK